MIALAQALAFSAHEVDDQWPQAVSENSNKHREAVPIGTLLAAVRGAITNSKTVHNQTRSTVHISS